MNKRLHILYLEDDPDFVELVRTMFAEEGMNAELTQAGDAAGFKKALKENTFDAIVSDYHLPNFTGREALTLVQKTCPQTPFILVSGVIGEQAAIEILKAGATDYVLKQQPERLPSAVRRAVEGAVESAKLHEAELELARREKYFRSLTENSLDILYIMSREANFRYVSPSIKQVLGYTPEELIGENAFARVHAEDLARAKQAFQTVLDHPERTVKIQFRYKSKDGEWRRLELIGNNRLSDPDIAGLVGNCRDMTDRWRAEEELRESERQYRLLFQGNPNPMWVFDLESQEFLEVNEAAVQQYGYTREEFLAMTISEIRASQRIINSPKVATPDPDASGVTWRHQRKDGSLIYAEVIWTPMVFKGRLGALTMAMDVTERRRLEHRNTVFSKLSRELSEASTDTKAAAIICEAAEALFHWTDFALDLYDTGSDEMRSLLTITTVEGRRVEISPSPQPKISSALVKRVIEKGPELLTSDDTGSYAAATMLTPIRKGERVIGLMLIQNHWRGSYSQDDLEMLQTLAEQCSGALERVQSREQLNKSEQRFRDLFENSPDAIFVEDMNRMVLDANLAACALHGMTREQLIGKSAVNDLVVPGRRDEAKRVFPKLASGELSWAEGERLKADGGSVAVEVRASRIEYGGKPALLLHVRDITERQAAEAALESSEAQFRSVWENSADGMTLTDEEGIITAVNDAYCKMVGMEAKALEGKPFTDVFALSEDLEKMLNDFREHFAMRTANQKRQEERTLRDGRVVALAISISFIEAQGRRPLMLSLFRDITTQKRLEEQLRQSQKMEAIGQLAGGVAHDFNNILTVIHGHASLLAGAQLGDVNALSAQRIVQSAERAAGLTRQLLTFSRRQLIQPRHLDMNKIVGNMTDMLGRILGEDVAVQLNYSAAQATVEADAGMMEQVLLNLAVNARDAMPRGGQLAVRISIVDLDEGHVGERPEARSGRFVRVSVSDNGCGIPAENLPRIFEPFFTTKGIGKGTGLGLATVYGIVKQHGGWVEVESIVGKSSTFRVFIPYVAGEQGKATKDTTKIIVHGGTETILLVEDEKPVCELVASVLSKYGYKVLQACSGAEAVGVWHAHKDGIQLLLTDLIMPGGMNGRELAETLWTERPELKVVFTSGYSADIVGKDFKIESGLNFLQKPYHPQTLALAVRRCLDGKRA